MEKHFVTFLSPGTFVAEDRTVPIESWDTDKAQVIAESVQERYGATPYGFYFTTRTRSDSELDSSVAKKSPLYYLPHCKIETLAEVRRRNDPKDSHREHGGQRLREDRDHDAGLEVDAAVSGYRRSIGAASVRAPRTATVARILLTFIVFLLGIFCVLFVDLVRVWFASGNGAQ
jgi:hypothetical protein